MAIKQIVATVSLVPCQLRLKSYLVRRRGFFYSRNASSFVTNQHVVRDDARNVIPDTSRLYLHTNPRDVSTSADFDIPLYNGTQRLWKIHVTQPEADIAAIKSDKQEIENRFFVKRGRANSFFRSIIRLIPVKIFSSWDTRWVFTIQRIIYLFFAMR